MKERFMGRAFTAASMEIIKKVNAVLDEYRVLGYDLSLRQLYYQLVARGYIENSQRSYKNVGSLVSDARLAGLVDWDMIKDRGREQVVPSHWATPADIMDSAAYSFRIDKWADQANHIIVMVEKQALEGVLIPACRALDVAFIANKGYSSSSTMYEIGKQLLRTSSAGKYCHVLYLGDHDPSGIDMTRDVRERLDLFGSGALIEVHRLALNYDQVEELHPPENPAKETDSRFRSYADEFGESSWELDAIEPTRLAAIVRGAVEDLRDDELWDKAVQEEETMRSELRTYADNYRRNHPSEA